MLYYIIQYFFIQIRVYVYTNLLTYIFRVLGVPKWRITWITKGEMPWKLGFMQVDEDFHGVPFRLALKLKVEL